jgi:hypothetical protein
LHEAAPLPQILGKRKNRKKQYIIFIYTLSDSTQMPKFLDAHALKGTDEETLRNLQKAPADEFGIKHVNLMYNQDEDRFFCLTEAPNKDAVQKHHSKHGFNCEWITEVKTTA